MSTINKKLLLRVTPCFGRHVKALTVPIKSLMKKIKNRSQGYYSSPKKDREKATSLQFFIIIIII
jgi:hypothetical protein